MKNVSSLILGLGLLFLVIGCDNAAQKQAFTNASVMEQQPYGNLSVLVIAEYQKVIQMDPGSKWADRAQQRIDVIRQNISADQAARQQRLDSLQQSIDADRTRNEQRMNALISSGISNDK